ncbi:MAG TPA: NAD(P)-dependent oxidoreductase [Thermoleophilaceae bacterium]|nr:NAD(P)-dependent oxidoreductase [Thermoleophilaceae bacterium]
MRVLVAGATGAVGRPLCERLVAAGHEVVGTTRSDDGAARLRAAGVEPAVLDAFDLDALRAAVEAARPEVVINQLTALSAPFNPRRYGEWIAETNRLRAEVGPALVEIARETGARRVIAQSISFVVRPGGEPVADESAPLYLDGPRAMAEATGSVATLERGVTGTDGIEGVVLRYGYLYGPGTSYAADGDIADAVRARRFPIVGSGAGVFSFVHTHDAADATVLALDRGEGVLNVVDDEPAPLRDWLPAYAAALGAPPPRRVPAFLARLAAGSVSVHYGTRQVGASNARARAGLGWNPGFGSWREGFPASFAGEDVRIAA